MSKKRMKKSIASHKGTTIVEMLICFLLLSILMVAASQMIASSMKTYSTAKRSIAGREVADVIADQIEGSIEKAYAKKSIKITDANKKISFSDNQKRAVKIGVDDAGHLDMMYGKDGDSHWKFDVSVYRGYSITGMRFIAVEPDVIPDDEEPGLEYLDKTVYRPGTYKLELELSNPKEGVYTAERYINCVDMN